MNAGMYGMADGRGMARRRLAAVSVGKIRTQVTSAVNAIGAASQSVPLTTGVRTRVLTVSGRGAVRALAVEQGLGTTSLQLEAWVDGVLVADTGTVTTSTNGGVIAVGAGIQSQPPFWDWVPFDTAFEVFVTCGSTGSVGFGAIYDLHQ